MAERKCGNCKHFSSCSGVNADDVPENMMCNDFEAAPAAGGKDIGDKAEETPSAETKTTTTKTGTTTRRKAAPAVAEDTTEVPPPGDDDPGMPPADDDMPPGDDDPGMPPADDDIPPADDDMPPAGEHEEIDNDWDVFGSNVMSRYVGPKAARLAVEAAKVGINVDGMKPADMHEALLRWKAEQDEQASADDQLPPEEDESKPDPRAVAPSQDEIEAKRKAYEAQCGAPAKECVDHADVTINPLACHALIGVKAELEKQIAVLQRQVIALDLVIESM